MKKAHIPEDVIEYFGGVPETQVALKKRSRQIVYYWKKRGRMPELLARQASDLSNGQLKFDPRVYLDS